MLTKVGLFLVDRALCDHIARNFLHPSPVPDLSLATVDVLNHYVVYVIIDAVFRLSVPIFQEW
jgi:hypothetical protein